MNMSVMGLNAVSMQGPAFGKKGDKPFHLMSATQKKAAHGQEAKKHAKQANAKRKK